MQFRQEWRESVRGVAALCVRVMKGALGWNRTSGTRFRKPIGLDSLACEFIEEPLWQRENSVASPRVVSLCFVLSRGPDADQTNWNDQSGSAARSVIDL
jgi:hypothetical protein